MSKDGVMPSRVGSFIWKLLKFSGIAINSVLRKCCLSVVQMWESNIIKNSLAYVSRFVCA